MDDQPRRKFHPVYLCLALPFIVYVWEPSYNRVDPELFGSLLFYWWQMAWILGAALCILPVYLFEEKRR